MRLVQLRLPSGRAERITGLLEENDLEFVITEESSGREFDGVVYFTVAGERLEPILDDLRHLGVDEDSYVVVLDTELVFSDTTKERVETDEEENHRISRQELHAHAAEMTPAFPIYVTLTVVSALVATAGLLLDSPAVVVGSMVIAPLIGPALGASIGTIIGDDELLSVGVRYQLAGIGLAIGAAAVFAAAVRYANVVPPGFDITDVAEIRERLAPNLLALVIALGAGVAGILSISAGVSVTLVGVMIAAALIPPAAVAGLSLAFGEPMAALGATVLVFVNLLSINLAGLITLWAMGYRPQSVFDIEPVQRAVTRQIVGLTVVVLIFTAFLVWITYTSFLVGVFEDRAEAEAAAVLDEEAYDEYRLVDLTVEPIRDYPFLEPERVVVTVSGPPGEPPPGLIDDLDEAVSAQTDDPVVVDVLVVFSAEDAVNSSPQLSNGSVGS